MRILLNTVKRDNFVFFDPDNRVHLNRVNPLGVASILTPSLKRALLGNTVIDIDNYFKIPVSDQNKKTNDILLKMFNIVRHEVKEEVVQKETLIVEEVKEELIVEVEEAIETKEEAVAEEAVEPTKPKRRKRNTKK